MNSRRGFCRKLLLGFGALLAPAEAREAHSADEGPRPCECHYFIGNLETPYCWSNGDGDWWRWSREGRVVKADYPPRLAS